MKMSTWSPLTAKCDRMISTRDWRVCTPQGDLHTMLLKIASEELKHKEKMEYLYANTAFPQTDGG